MQTRPTISPTPFKHTQWDTLAPLVKRVPKEVPSWSQAWAVWASLLAHGLLLAALVFTVSWKSAPPPALQAELWEALAKPVSVQVQPIIEPPAMLETKPEPQEQQALKVDDEAIAPKVVKNKKADSTHDSDKPVKKSAKELAREKRELAREKAREKKLEDMRQQEMARLNALSSKSVVGSVQVGSKQGVSSSYKVVLQACVQPHLRFADTTVKDLYVEMNVQLSANRNPVAIKVVKSSGNTLFDAAVERALLRCDPFPKDIQPLASNFNIIYRLGE